MRESAVVYINGERHDVKGPEAFMQLADWLRYKKGLTGTKIVCAEGDCGACTVLVSRLRNGKLTPYQSLNSCISFMWLFDKCHVITVEGLKKGDKLHPVQTALVKHNGAQCGYCTPGFVCALAGLAEDAKFNKVPLDDKHVKNATTGNLCRCTGYEGIIEAGKDMDLTDLAPLKEFFDDAAIERDLASLGNTSVTIKSEEKEAFLPGNLLEAIKAPVGAKLTSGATDLGVLTNKGKLKQQRSMSLSNVSALYDIREEKDCLLIGARASFTQVEKACTTLFPEFAKILHIFASPQIKNAGTLVGNIVNASPIADTIPFLRVAEAELAILGPEGERLVNINSFFKGGYKELDLKPGEIVTLVRIPKRGGRFKLYKVSKRRDMDISCVTFAVHYKLIVDEIESISFAFGGVGPTVLRLPILESMAKGKMVDEVLFRTLSNELKNSFIPLSDVRGSSAYRMVVCKNLMMKFYDELKAEITRLPQEATI